MRFFYTIVLYLLMPFMLLRLVARGFKASGYWQCWDERFGFFRDRPGKSAIWVHAVSVGEAQAAIPLINRLADDYPDSPIVVTTTTPTGLAHVRRTLADRVHSGHLPYDLPGSVRRFLSRVNPRVAIIMETELWPNLFAICRNRGVPVVVANARLSERSFNGYRRFSTLTRQTLACVADVAAQGESDAERLRRLGMDPARLSVVGSIKFDLSYPSDLAARGRALRSQLGEGRPVLIAASTHEGEETQVLDAFERIRGRLPEVLLILVPRHPERFDAVAQLCRDRGYLVLRRTEGSDCPLGVSIYLGDTMGELPLLYAAADVAFVGGSLVPIGGHNILEPAALGVPVAVGTHTFNFAEVTDLMVAEGGVRRVESPAELAAVMLNWLQDRQQRQMAGEQGRRVTAANRGAVQRLAAIVGAQLPRSEPDPTAH